LQRDDVTGHASDRAFEHVLVQLRGSQRLIQPRPASIPRLKLSPWQLGLHLQHAGSEKGETLLVFIAGSFQVEADFQAAVPCVVPGLVVKLRTAEVQLHEAAPPARAPERSQGCRKPRLYPLAQAAEEVRRSQYRASSQSTEYISYSSGAMGYVPTVTENEGGNRERTFDIYSRLLKDRIILIGRPIDDVVANLVVAQLMYLAADDPEKEIQIYVNSPGGSVSSGFAIYDTMQYVRAPISTVCIGRAASFGTVVLMAGAKGRRFSLPSSNIHMHQPLIGGRGLQGQASDLDIHAREIIRIRGVLNELIAKHTGQPLERVERDTDRDYFLTPQEAVDYGLIDGIIQSTSVPALAAATQA